MLINKKESTNVYKTFKLNSGEEVVGKLLSESTTHYTIETPLTIIMTKQGFGYDHWLKTSDQQVVNVSKASVSVMCDAADEAIASYVQSTSGLIV